MKRSFLLIVSLVALSVSVSGQAFKTVSPGVEHAHVRRDFSGKPVDIQLLKLDLSRVRIDVHHAKNAAVGTETTSAIAARQGAIAAINAGFFRLDTSPYAGDPVGLMMIDGHLVSEPTNERIQLLIDNSSRKTNVFFARTTLAVTVNIGRDRIDVLGVNRELRADDIVLYTPKFGPTTMVAKGTAEVVVMRGRVASISEELGNAAIPPQGYVIAATGSRRAELLRYAGDTRRTVSLTHNWDGLPGVSAKARRLMDAVTGVPQLISNGRIDITWEREKSNKAFVETPHPRTAVARLRDGKFLMLTADGRTEQSGGLGLEDLAAYLLELGAVDAMNLDGGGSTTMWVRGKVVNRPSDPLGERKVSDALLVTRRR